MRPPVKRGPGRPVGNTGQATRQRLLEAAHREFCDLGYAAATTPSIVARAGVSQSVLYHHFGSKQALYTAVIEWQVGLSIEAFEAAIAPHTLLLDRIDAMLEALEVIWQQHGSDNSILVMAPFELRRNPELKAARIQLRRNEEFFTKLVAEAQDTDHVDEGVVQMCIALIWGLSGVGAINSDTGVFIAAVEAVRTLLSGNSKL
jgi:AcrR family transcriptional regulator